MDLRIYSYHIECILKVLVYIEEHLEEELSLEKMAQIAHISPFYFHRLFHAYMGEPLAEYVQKLRIRRAATRLQYSDTPITEIAFAHGYESPASFTKVFHHLMGTSPSKYRKALQPHLQAMMQRTSPYKKKAVIQPEYVQREEEKVLFLRAVGDYRETPWLAFNELMNFLKDASVPKEDHRAYYSIALDDPDLVERAKCRFDACVALKTSLPPKGNVGQRTLPGGRFAVFSYKGPYSDLETVYDEIFQRWYSTTDLQLADAISFCEHSHIGDPSVPMAQRLSKLYIPLK